MTEPESSATGADDELWLTYLNYDRSVQQAVNRLGALSSNNVDEFRALLLKGRDRARVKEYEAESIRRLQGEAFVGDDELQRALIVLNAEDVRLGDELKRIVAMTGRPSDLDQTVAVIRSRQGTPPEQESSPAKADVLPLRQPPAPQPVVPQPVAPEPVRPVSNQTKVEQPLPQTAAAPARSALKEPQQVQRPAWTKRLAVIGAIFIVGAVGAVVVSSRLVTNDATRTLSVQPTPPVQAVPPPLRATADDQRTVPAATPGPAAQHSSPEAQDGDGSSGRMASSAEPAQKNTPPSSDVSAVPVPGSRYKVVRGDMLSEIALRAYRDASKFRLIQSANPGLRNGPDRIYYDQVIYIPPAP